MFRRRYLLAGLFLSVLALTSCGGGVDFSSQSSESGLLPENFVPYDVGMIVSYSLRNADQYSAVQAIEEKLGDSGRLSRTFSDQFDASLKEVGLDFERDLQPAFGDQFRFLYAARMIGSDTEETVPDTFVVVTLEDPSRLESAFQVLVDADSLDEKTVDGAQVYVNNDQSFYATIHDDLLLVANTADNLVDMNIEEKSVSLWNSDDYQKALEEVGDDHVLYAMLFPAHYLGDVSTLLKTFSMSDIPSIIDHQTVVARAEDDGIRFEAYVAANKGKAKTVDVSLDQIPHKEPYLMKEVPADHLLGYFESYGLKQSLEVASALDGDEDSMKSISDTVRSYLGMDFEEDILSFLDKGYAVAFHANGEGLFPGVSIFVDASSNTDGAQQLLDKVDGQISGLLAVFEQSLPGAFAKDTIEVGDDTLNRVKVDLSAVPRSENSPLPASLTEGPIQFVYGMLGDRLLISTASVWEEDSSDMISDSELYTSLDSRLEDVDQGLILVDAQELADFAANLRALREQLDLQVSDSAMSLEDFLKGFEGAMAQSHSNAYDSLFSGYLELAQ